MSRIAKNSIKIDQDTSCKFEEGNFFAKGKLGEMNYSVNPLYVIDIKGNEIFVNPVNDKDKLIPNWGTTRAIISNIVILTIVITSSQFLL